MNKKKGRKKPSFTFHAALGDKRAAFSVAPRTEKKPATSVSTTWNDEHPSWRIARLEVVDPFGWHEVPQAKLLDIRQKLSNFESMTWNQIKVERHDQNHAVPVYKLIPVARRRLAELGLDSLDELFRLRLSNLERVWGILDGAVMQIIWWDPLHQICPAPLKHT